MIDKDYNFTSGGLPESPTGSGMSSTTGLPSTTTTDKVADQMVQKRNPDHIYGRGNGYGRGGIVSSVSPMYLPTAVMDDEYVEDVLDSPDEDTAIRKVAENLAIGGGDDLLVSMQASRSMRKLTRKALTERTLMSVAALSNAVLRCHAAVMMGEANSALAGVEVDFPEPLRKELAKVMRHHPGGDGKTFLQNLVATGKLSYENMVRKVGIMDKLDIKGDEYAQYGGRAVHEFMKRSLEDMRKNVERRKKMSKDNGGRNAYADFHGRETGNGERHEKNN